MDKRTISRRLGFGACLGRGPGTRLRRGLALLLGRRLCSLFGTAGALSVLTRPVKDLLPTRLRHELLEVLAVQGIGVGIIIRQHARPLGRSLAM